MSSPATQTGIEAPVRGETFRLSFSPALNGLRGVAILAVLAFHSDEALLKGGFIGVDLFFVLSGFLITSLLIQEYDHTESVRLKAFYLRRVLRLGPALLLLLLAYCLAWISFRGFPGARSHVVDALIALFYSANWARALNLHPPSYLGHTWSLSIEEQFYAIWPLLLLTMLRKIRSRWRVALLASSLALAAWGLRTYLKMGGATSDRLYNGFDTRADAVMVGCVLGILVASNLAPRPVQGWISHGLNAASVLAVGLLATFSIFAVWDAPVMFYWLYFAIELLTAFIILDCFINPHSVVKKILSWKALVWIGTISYGLYLWHYPIYEVMKDYGYSRSQVVFLGTLLTFATATLSYYLIEQPFLKLKKKLAIVPRA